MTPIIAIIIFVSIWSDVMPGAGASVWCHCHPLQLTCDSDPGVAMGACSHCHYCSICSLHQQTDATAEEPICNFLPSRPLIIQIFSRMSQLNCLRSQSLIWNYFLKRNKSSAEDGIGDTCFVIVPNISKMP